MAEKGKNIWSERALLESKAYRSLNTALAHKILTDFFIKRQFVPMRRKKSKNWILTNNGKIEYTYLEARKRYNIADTTFKKTIDELRDKGFIDIASGAGGVFKVKNFYAISDRWRKYEMPDYEPPLPRPKSVNRGFQKGNQYGRNCRKKINSTVAEQHRFTVEEQHSVKLDNQGYVSGIT